MSNGGKSMGRSGFTLVEVTLAILVVAIGLMAVFALFPAGLNLNKRAIDDTQAALFAEEILNGLRAKVESSPDGWRRLTDAPLLYVGAPTVGMWYTPNEPPMESDPYFRVNLNAPVKAVVYTQRSASGVIDYAVRCRLETGAVGGNVKFARLYVWNGQYGPTADASAYVFYTEFYDYGVVP